MTFVNEKISDDDKQKYGLSPIYDLWTIDRQNNAFLMCVGGVREATFYEFHWNKCVAKIAVNVTHNLRERNVYDLSLNFHSIQMESALHKNIKIVLGLIDQAFKTLGFAGNKTATGSVVLENLDTIQIEYVDNILSKVRG